MIVAGIDEAGYGPLLGPLVVGCCAFETPASADVPCLWTLLRNVVSKKRVRSGRKLHVNDSKLVYSASQGLREPERSTLTVVSGGEAGFPESLDVLLQRTAPALGRDLGKYPWYQGREGERFPLEQDALSVRLMANALQQEMRQAGVSCRYYRAAVLLERELNQRFEQTRNKASVLFSAAAEHLDYLLRNFGDQGLLVICDRQGGREHYGRLLRLMFEEWALEIVEESEGRAEYLLRRNGHAARLIFVEKAESQCMSVALASMLCKYLREGLMHRFNAYWQALLPDLTPTAGYYSDGQRFLKDIDGKRRELGVADHQLIRSR